jgi:hypothetical protein
MRVSHLGRKELDICSSKSGGLVLGLDTGELSFISIDVLGYENCTIIWTLSFLPRCTFPTSILQSAHL